MSRTIGDERSALAAALGSQSRNARSYTITVDTNLRMMVLPAGGWRLYGHDTVAVRFAERSAVDAAGTLSDGLTAPATGDLDAPVAGTPATGKAWVSGDLTQTTSLGSATRGGIPLPTDAREHKAWAVRDGRFLAVYLKAASATTLRLEGPYEYAL